MRRLAFALAAILLAAGCSSPDRSDKSDAERDAAPGSGTSAGPGETGAGGASSGPSAAAVAPVVPAVLRFGGKTLDGAAFDASAMAGKPAILWFWAPWCATCASQAMSIADVAAEYGDRLAVLGIAGMGGNKAMHEFVDDLDVGAITHLDDQPGKIWKRFKITQQSTYVIVDRAGTVVRQGYLDDQQLTAQVTSLVG